MRKLGLGLICVLLAGDAPRGEGAEPLQGVTLDLFDGVSLDGWIATGCEVGVEDGLLVLQSGNGLLRTHHRYRDFELQLSWRARGKEKWDSGVFFRAGEPPAPRPWPADYQINLRKGLEGELVRTSAPKPSGMVRDGQWNQFRLRVIGRTATLWINDQHAWTFDGLEADSGYLGLQAEVPGGGQFEFKDIRVTELGYRALFNGQDLQGWEAASGQAAVCWQVEDGLLMCNGKKGTWLRTTDEHGDFNLRLEYKLQPGGNSGVYLRIPGNGMHHGDESGIEVQILDDAADRYSGLKPYQFSGSLYAIVAAEPRVSRPAGQWNTLEINARGTSYRVVHNGIAVVDASSADAPELEQRRIEGFLGLQNHKEPVWFRRLRIGAAE